jgi:hypothetical protein
MSTRIFSLFLFILIFPAALLAQDAIGDLGLPEAVTGAITFILPMVAKFLNAKIESKFVRWLVPFALSALTAIAAALMQGVGFGDMAVLLATVFTGSQAAYRMLYKPVWDRRG